MKYTRAEDLVNFLTVDIESIREVTADIVLSSKANQIENILFNSRNCLRCLERALTYAQGLLKIQEEQEEQKDEDK